MRNSRSLIDHEYLIKKHNLNTAPPPPDSLFWKMWDCGKQIAQQTLNTGFLKGIKAGNLDPIKYGAFNVSDMYYCFSGAEDYGVAAKRVKNNQVLKDYLIKKQESYDQYNKTACATWGLSGPQSVVPSAVARDYSKFESSVAKGMAEEGDVIDPIFTLIVMLPCDFLWSWLAEQLDPPTPGNIYADWITSNNYPDGAYAMGNFLQDYITKNPIDEDLAVTIYRIAMEYEYKNFCTATATK